MDERVRDGGLVRSVHPQTEECHQSPLQGGTDNAIYNQDEIQDESPCTSTVRRRGYEPCPLELVRLQGKNLIRYQDTYAEQMAAYGLQRGIKGSEVQHISTHEYYRSLISQGEDLQANITQLLEEQEKARLVEQTGEREHPTA